MEEGQSDKKILDVLKNQYKNEDVNSLNPLSVK